MNPIHTKFLVLFQLLCITQTAHTQSIDSLAIGVVNYLQLIDLQQEMDKNGIANLWFNATASQYVQTGAPASTAVKELQNGHLASIPGDPQGFPIFKNHKTKQITFRTNCFNRDWGKYCLVSDTLGTINWAIDPTSKKHFGAFECQKAEGEFRGRTYEVWFAPDLPIPSGPYKLGGLPGLILEAKSKDGLVQFLFHSLELSLEKPPVIKLPEGHPTSMDYRAYKDANFKYVTESVQRTIAENPGITGKVLIPHGQYIEEW